MGDAATLAVRMAMSAPVNSRQAQRLDTPAVKATRETEPYFRATYILEAARRMSNDMKLGATGAAALETEKRYLDLHKQAADRRFAMARQVDLARERFGEVLGWYAKQDSRVSAECARAHGSNFSANVMPKIGYPGTVHPRCRCLAGPPHKGKRVRMLAVRAS
jgi:hypothetical protein